MSCIVVLIMTDQPEYAYYYLNKLAKKIYIYSLIISTIQEKSVKAL